jgi:hypothetical protein
LIGFPYQSDRYQLPNIEGGSKDFIAVHIHQFGDDGKVRGSHQQDVRAAAAARAPRTCFRLWRQNFL